MGAKPCRRRRPVKTPVIVVGVDGSVESRAALRWAAEEAGRREAELAVVHAYEWRVIGDRAPVGGAYADQARLRAQSLIDSTVDYTRSIAPEVAVRGSGCPRVARSDSGERLGDSGPCGGRSAGTWWAGQIYAGLGQ